MRNTNKSCFISCNDARFVVLSYHSVKYIFSSLLHNYENNKKNQIKLKLISTQIMCIINITYTHNIIFRLCLTRSDWKTTANDNNRMYIDVKTYSESEVVRVQLSNKTARLRNIVDSYILYIHMYFVLKNKFRLLLCVTVFIIFYVHNNICSIYSYEIIIFKYENKDII